MSSTFDFAVASVLMWVLNAIIVGLIRRNRPAEEGAFLARVYTATLLLRFGAASLINLGLGTFDLVGGFWGDSSQYDSTAVAMAAWGTEQDWVRSRVSGWGWAYAISRVYAVFGHNVILVQFLNGTLGSLTVLIVYSIAKDLFGQDPARFAARCQAYFPGMIVWSTGLFKDPPVLFCIATAMWAVVRMRHGITAFRVALWLAATLPLMTIRFYVFYFVLFATLGTFALTSRRGLGAGLLSQAVLAGAFVAAFSTVSTQATVDRHLAYLDLEHIEVVRQDQARMGQTDFAEDVDVSAEGGLLAALPVGLAFLLLAPFPWMVFGSLRMAMAVPETLVWYSLLPAFWAGFRHVARHQFRECLPILTFTVLLTLAYAIVQTNVGTAYRQRTQVTMFFFMFMGVGQQLREKQRAERREALALQPLSR